MVTGVVFTDTEVVSLTGQTSNLPNSLGTHFGPTELVYDPQQTAVNSGGFTRAIVDPLGVNLNGSTIDYTYFDDYYNQIWIQPASFDFGSVSTESSKTVMLWNAFWRTRKTLASIQIESGEGMRLSGPAAPKTLRPLEHVQYSVTALVDGPATISTVYRFVFTGGPTVQLPVIGTRAKVWMWPVNWRDSYKLTYDFLTEIFVTHSGREQRIAKRLTPRKTLSFTASLSGDAFAKFKDLMWSWQHRTLVVPEETRKTTLSGSLFPGADSVDIANPPSWIQPEATLVLEYAGNREIRVVESVAGDSVTFKTVSENGFPAGSTVYYGVFGYLSDSIRAVRKTNSTAEVGVVFNVKPASEAIYTGGTPWAKLNGREIFDKRPNWATDIAGTHSHDVYDLDYGFGTTSRFTPVQYGRVLRQAAYLARTVDEADQMLDFFCRHYGQQGEFYVPTWEPDIKPGAVADASSSTLIVAGRELFDSYATSTVNRALAVRFSDGSMLYRAILSIDLITTIDGIATSITVDGVWGRTFGPDDIDYVCWLLASRFASDGLTIEFLTDSVAQFQITTQSVEDLTPET